MGVQAGEEQAGEEQETWVYRGRGVGRIAGTARSLAPGFKAEWRGRYCQLKNYMWRCVREIFLNLAIVLGGPGWRSLRNIDQNCDILFSKTHQYLTPRF